MKGFVNSIEKLGRRVEMEYRRANADQRLLPKIAASALRAFDDVDGLGLNTLASFLQETSQAQQAHNPFSDLPVTVFSSRDFYIELLVWSHATTAIHQHGFSGAFRIVRGSSVHTRYRFRPWRRVSEDCLLGDVQPLGSEELVVGSIRKIEPGIDGLIHSLYHLDNPSLSLIIRTRGHSAFGPQYSYYPPALALHRKALESDELVLMYSRFLNISRSTDRVLFRSLWLNKIAALEFPRMAWMYLRHRALLESDERTDFYQHSEAVHGELAGHLFEAVEQYSDQQVVARLREQITDSELRFFLALLLNVPERDNLLSMVAKRFPGRPPVECCADWLSQLSVDEQSEFWRMKEIASLMESSRRQTMSFSRDLRRALPSGTGSKAAREIFAKFIEKGVRATSENVADPLPAEQENAFNALAAMPQLRGLR